MSTLITGASGFVGRALCDFLSESEYVVVAAQRNLIQTKKYKQVCIPSIDAATDWSEALKDVSTVVHLAARVHVFNEQSFELLAEFRKTNVEGTLNLARQASRAGVKRFIFISSLV